ncbi:hypothetical protein Mapa_006405 [Marchantia paleacea]|nr:hypothetical protein Mapa_006405 [Marchantia paleacea]
MEPSLRHIPGKASTVKRRNLQGLQSTDAVQPVAVLRQGDRETWTSGTGFVSVAIAATGKPSPSRTEIVPDCNEWQTADSRCR